MSEIHFRSNVWPFQIDKQFFVNFFDKMAAVGHFGCPKFTFDHISGHFRSIRNWFLTRLLGRPQPQMYPPVAVNQYIWVNRTHKHLLHKTYISIYIEKVTKIVIRSSLGIFTFILSYFPVINWG